MNKYLVLGLIILALMPIMAMATYACEECDSRGYECGTWTIGDTTVNCGSCYSDEHCVNGICRDECESHDERRCYKDDVYWYDSCGDREEKYESCDDYCSDGRCREWNDDDDYDDDDYYYYGGSYYHHYSYSWCDNSCNYLSFCAETGRDSCGRPCYRETDGIECANSGVCYGGTCTSRQPVVTTQQVVVQEIVPYQTYIPYRSAPRQKSSGIAVYAIIFLAAGCIIALLLIGLLIGWAFRR